LGKQWSRIPGQITVGAYVQDKYEGRMNQPEGRGAIGKVVSVTQGERGHLFALVDFGRGYRVGIYFGELALVDVR
jgi:hypothetical protein